MQATPLTSVDYSPYGDAIEARADIKPVRANLGFAQRFNFVASLENLRPADAKANLCVFRCEPMVPPGQSAFVMRLLERHEFSTQVFIPMNGVRRYLVIVALGGLAPDLSTLRAFVATGQQGISYKPGVWHHPLVALDAPSDFSCLVWEDGHAGDCEVVKLASAVTINF